MIKTIKRILLFSLFFAAPYFALAWGVLGHRIVGEIADSYLTAKAKAEIKKILDEKKYSGRIATEVKPFIKFYPAEDYHQEYISIHPDNPYVRNVSIPDYQRFRKEFKEGNFKL